MAPTNSLEPALRLQPVAFLASSEARAHAWSTADALAYTRWLARHHYENFHVASALLPKRLRQDFYNVYAFCRWADDLGDEVGDTAQSLALLAWWREQLHALYQRGVATHPVFVSLAQTAEKYALPIEPFDRLITAFEHDQRITRYADWAEVDAYCVNSANPVGHLLLMLGGFRDMERFRLSDATCTALQLANFWQDVTVDLKKDRVYLPLDLLARHGCTVDDLFAHRFTPAFGAAMKEAVDRARALFDEGLKLVPMLDRRLALDIDLFNRGGMAVLEKIRQRNYDVLSARPAIGKSERVRLLLGAVLRNVVRAA